MYAPSRCCLQVEDGRSLVALCDRMVGVIGKLCSADDVTPLDADLVSGLHIDDLSRHWRSVAGVASEVRVVHILDRVVAVGDTDAIELAKVLAINPHALSNAVGRSEKREERERGDHGELHIDLLTAGNLFLFNH